MLEYWATTQFEECFLPSVNGSTFVDQHSSSLYSSFYPELHREDEIFYLILGSDSGLLCNYLENLKKPSLTKYLVIEVEPILKLIQAKTEKRDYKQCVLCSLAEWEAKAEELGLSNYVAIDKVKIICSLGVVDNYYTEYATIRPRFEQCVDQIRWKGKLLNTGFVFIEQQMRNLAENKYPAKLFEQTMQGATAILLAGGPSLDDALEWVIEHRKKLLVISVSRISRRLQEVGIIPDIIVAIDPTEKMFEVSKQLFSFPTTTLFVTAYHVTSLLPSIWEGKLAYLGSRLPWESAFNSSNLSVSGPTVTNSALNLLIAMGVSRVILAGVDLAYSATGYSHAKGSLEHASGARLAFQGQEIELNDGSIGQTEHAFLEASKTLAEQAVTAEQQGCLIINSSLKAAKIPGIAYTSLERIQLSLPKEPIIERLMRIDFQSIDDVAYLKDCQNELRLMEKRLHELRKLSQKALNLHAKPHLFVKVSAIEEQLNRDYKDVLILIKIVSYRYFLDIFRANLSALIQKESIIEASRVCFNAYRKGAQAVLEMIKPTRERIADRLEEFAESPNIDRLIKRWKNDKQYGRAKLWLKKNTLLASKLSLEQQRQFDELNQLHLAQLSFQIQVPRLDLSQYGQFKDVQNKLYRLYREGDLQNLKQLENSLSALKIPEGDLLACLAQAYQQELLGNFTLAIHLYHQAAKDALTESALNHLSSLLIQQGDIDNARLALESLTYLGCQYLPSYAKVCEYCGDLNTAMAAYENYLAICAEDDLAKAELARLRSKEKA